MNVAGNEKKPDKLTDNEIYRALECCRNKLCTECPRGNNKEHTALCQENLIRYAFDLINVAEVKHGEWLKTKAYPHKVYCSLCYKTYVTNEEVIHGRSEQRPSYCTEAEYCPHCGAKMDGKKEGAANV